MTRGVDGAFLGGFELEAELLLERCEEMGAWLSELVSGRVLIAGRPLQGEIVFAGQAGLD